MSLRSLCRFSAFSRLVSSLRATRLLLLGIALCAAGLELRAETRRILGLEVEVDSVTEADGGNVLVTIDGETRLITSTNLEDYLVAEAFSRAKRQLSQTSVIEFSSNALQKSKHSWFASAMRYLILSSQENPNSSSREILYQAGALEGLKLVPFNSLSAGKFQAGWMCSALFRLVFAEPKWAEMHLREAVQRHQAMCSDEIRFGMIKELEATHLNSTERLTYALDKVLSLDLNSGLEIRNILSRVDQLSGHVSRGETSLAVRVLEQFSGDPAVVRAVKSYAARKAEEYAEKLLIEKNPEDALRSLAIVDPSVRTPKTHALVRTALEQLDGKSSAIIMISEVATMLRSYARKDQAIQERYTTALEVEIDRRLAASKTDKVEELIDHIRAVRPDPNVANDEVRVKFALALMKVGLVDYASLQIRSVTSAISLPNRMRLFIAGYYISFETLLVGFLTPLIAVAILMLGKRGTVSRPQPARAAPSRNASTSAAPEKEETPLRPFVAFGPRNPGDEQRDEYNGLLATFRLPKKVTIRQIKNAYRQAVKTCHPDLNPNAGPGIQSEFIRLTKAYDRLVELHMERHGDG